MEPLSILQVTMEDFLLRFPDFYGNRMSNVLGLFRRLGAHENYKIQPSECTGKKNSNYRILSRFSDAIKKQG